MMRELEGNLEVLRKEMDTHLMSKLYSDQQKVPEAIRQASDSTKQVLNGTHVAIMRELASLGQEGPKGRQVTEQQLSTVLDLLRRQDSARKGPALIASLKFPGLRGRSSEVTGASTGTYGWIFDKRASPFTRWLETSSAKFWISGKPGSGKSTLMKFLVNHPSTVGGLHRWANGGLVVRASYFFKSSDKSGVQNVDRLYKSILFDILNQMPGAIAMVLQARSSGRDPALLDAFEWSTEQLQTALHVLLSRSHPRTRFCFFIDGLDEFGGDGGVQEYPWLLDRLEELVQSPNIKLCLSSRPENEFMTRLGTDRKHLLMMHDLTRDDMSHYIATELSRSKPFGDLLRRDPNASILVQEIRQNAQGVFLWVKFVVKNLVDNEAAYADGHLFGDEICGVSQLLEQIRAFPKDLEPYYAHLFNRIDPVTYALSSKAFLLALGAERPIPALAFVHISKDYRDMKDLRSIPLEERALAVRSSSLAQGINDNKLFKEYNACIVSIRRRVYKWSQGLLEVRSEGATRPQNFLLSHKVYFIHRTARDYAEQQISTTRWIKRMESFDLAKSLCGIHLAVCKLLGPRSVVRPEALSSDFLDVAHEVLHYAQEVHQSDRVLAKNYLIELDTIGEAYSRLLSKQLNRSSHWTARARSWEDFEWGHSTFITWLANISFNWYVEDELARKGRKLGQTALDSLLDCYLRKIYSKSKMPGDQGVFPNAPMVHRLLKLGANPNAHLNASQITKKTVWTAFVKSLPQLKHSIQNISDFQQWQNAVSKNVIAVLIKYGADLSIPIVLAEGWKRKNQLTAKDMVPVMGYLKQYGYMSQSHPRARENQFNGQRIPATKPQPSHSGFWSVFR